MLAVRRYLRFGLSYRDVEELLTERGVEVDHVTIYRWGAAFTPLLADAARPCRHATGQRWFVDETYVKVTGRWRSVYRAVDRSGQVVDVLVRRRVAPFGCLEPVAADGGTGKEQEGKRQRPQPSRGRWWELLI